MFGYFLRISYLFWTDAGPAIQDAILVVIFYHTRIGLYILWLTMFDNPRFPILGI